MPVKNNSATTWYKPLPGNNTPGPPRHTPQQTQQHGSGSRSPKHMPSFPSSGLPCPSQQPKPNTVGQISNGPPQPGTRVPGHSSAGQGPSQPPSKLPTTMTSSSSSNSAPSSPKRAIPQTKIASPTRIKNTDRLPPISKGTTATTPTVLAPLGPSQAIEVTGLKPVASNQKVRGKDEKEAKERMNENRIRRRSSSSGSGSDGSSLLKKGNRENAKKGKGNTGNTIEGTVSKKKVSLSDNKLITKGVAIIPKRKKSERSNSDNEIKPNKIIAKDLSVIASKMEEIQEKVSSDVTSTTTTICVSSTNTSTSATTTITTTTTSTASLAPEVTPRNRSNVKPQGKFITRPGRKISLSVTGDSLSSTPAVTKNLRPGAPPQVSRKDPLKVVERMLKQMDVSNETKIDETHLGKSIEKSLEYYVISGPIDESAVVNVTESNSEQNMESEEECVEKHQDEDVMICDEDKSDVKDDVCMEEVGDKIDEFKGEELIEVDAEGKAGNRDECAGESASGVPAVTQDHLGDVGDMQMSCGENSVSEKAYGAVSESECHLLMVHVNEETPLPPPFNLDDAEDAATDQSMRDDDSLHDDKSMIDAVEITEQEHAENEHSDAQQCMEDDGGTLVVELALDGTVQDVMIIDDGTNAKTTEKELDGQKDFMADDTKDDASKSKKTVTTSPKEASETKSLEKENPKMKNGRSPGKLAPKTPKGTTEKMIKSSPSSVTKKETKPCEDTKTKKKEEPKKEEDSMKNNSERRTKRKMEADKARGGTKKPAILFVDKDVDKLATNTTSRPVSPCPSDVSTSSDQSNLSHVSSRVPLRALHVSGASSSATAARVGSLNSLCSTVSGDGGDSRASRDSRVLTANRVNINNGEKKRSEPSAPPRRPRLDNVKSTIPKPGRLPPRKLTDPVKAARPGGPTSGPRGPHHTGHGGSGGPGQQERPVSHAEQLRRLEAERAARASELKAARAETEQAERRVEALTVLIHHLTNHYEPFSCPTLKAEVVRLNQQLTDTRLSLDESSAAVRRLQEEAALSVEQHGQKVQELEQRHRQSLEHLTKQHKHDLDLAIEKHRKEMSQFAEEQQSQREDVSRAHAAEMERLEGEWRTKIDLQHEKHLIAVQELNTQHTHKLRELESSRQAREFELEEANHRLVSEQEALKIQSKKLEESLLNDTDHRLQAVRNMCSSLKSEVDSLKTVVEMKNTEIHTLRGQVVEMGRLSKELEVARERAKSLQAKTEDLQAQMEKRALSERRLVNEHRHLVETCQREANINKRLSLENEELAWKLRQREEMFTSLPSSTLDLVSRSPATPRRQEGTPSPQAAPHSPRVAVRSPSGKISPSKGEVNKRRSRLGLSPENGVNGDDRVQDVSFESPPPSPCVKAVVEKSNSVSFILDLNDSQSDDSFLDLPPSPRPRPQRTASLSAADRPRTPIHARVIHNNRANSLNRNGGIHLEGRQNGKSESHGKKKEVNGRSRSTNGHGNHQDSGRSTSESEGGEMERVSPTGLAWTVPVHSPKSPVKANFLRQNGSPVRGRLEHHLLEDPDEDEYEETSEGTHQFIEVVELSRVGLASSSEAASDSEFSQCDMIKDGSSTESDSESSDGESHTQQDSSHHEPLGHKNGPWCPKEGAGEAMITDELLKQYSGDTLGIEALPSKGKRLTRRCLPSNPSSDSEDNMNAHNEGTTVDVSWSEDITSSSEMHEL